MPTIFEITRAIATIEIEDKGGVYPFDFIVGTDIPLYYETANNRKGDVYFPLPYPVHLEQDEKDRIGTRHYAKWCIDYPGDNQRVERASAALEVLNKAQSSRGENPATLETNKLLTIYHYFMRNDLNRGWSSNIEWSAGFIHLLSSFNLIQPLIDKPDILEPLLREDFMWQDDANAIFNLIGKTNH